MQHQTLYVPLSTNANITAPMQLQQCDVNKNDVKQCCIILTARISAIVNASLPDMRPKNNEKTKKGLWQD